MSSEPLSPNGGSKSACPLFFRSSVFRLTAPSDPADGAQPFSSNVNDDRLFAWVRDRKLASKLHTDVLGHLFNLPRDFSALPQFLLQCRYQWQ